MSVNLSLPLTIAAANWVIRQGRGYDSLPTWDPATSGMPPPLAGCDPVMAVILPMHLQLPFLSGEDRARAMRRLHDPDERSVWAFVPGLLDNEVWLVHVKRVPTALN